MGGGLSKLKREWVSGLVCDDGGMSSPKTNNLEKLRKNPNLRILTPDVPVFCCPRNKQTPSLRTLKESTHKKRHEEP